MSFITRTTTTILNTSKILLWMLVCLTTAITFASTPASTNNAADDVYERFNYDYLKNISDNWKFIATKDGIHLFEKGDGDESPMAFRGIGILNAPIYAVLHALREVESSYLWTPNLIQKKMVKENNYLDAITYNVNHLPWPATDRDSLLHSVLKVDNSLDKKNKFINVLTKSVLHSDYPELKDKVRGVLHSSNFILRQLGPNTTYVDLDAHFDPRGLIPKWLVNYVQRDWPYKFLKGLEKRALENPIPSPHPEFVRTVNETNQHQQDLISNTASTASTTSTTSKN
ncbi:MAG: hypothetical protein HQK53_11235 [Oligoflexia bacterium]|nr:hypothetical protein [Oligoflexia bacterium]